MNTELTKLQQTAVAYSTRAAINFEFPRKRGRQQKMDVKTLGVLMDALEKAFEEGAAFAKREEA